MIRPMEDLYNVVAEVCEKKSEYLVKRIKMSSFGLYSIKSLSTIIKDERTKEYIHVTIDRWNEPEENHPEQKPYRNIELIYGTLKEDKPNMKGTYRIKMKGTDRGVKGSIYESIERSKGWDWKEVDATSLPVTMLVLRLFSILDPTSK